MSIAPPATRHEVEVLIAEARRRQRRRRQALAAVLLAAGSAALIVWIVPRHGPVHRSRPANVTSPHRANQAIQPTRELYQPAALAAGPHGEVFVADDTRNMIFALHRDGRITIVAGTGTQGFSGDGGQASRAALNDPAGIAYDAKTHTLYLADSGNNRVRAVNARGNIRTVVGGAHGNRGWVPSGTPARRADFPAPLAVAFSPSGELYASNGTEVIRLSPSGTLTHIAGTRRGPQGVVGVGGPATRASIDGSDGLAFDHSGDLYLTGENTKALLAITPAGRMRDLCSYCLYPRGNAGIVTSPHGEVLAMAPTAIYQYQSLAKRHTVINFSHVSPVDGVRGVSPAGIAVSATGVIYIDTNPNDGYSNSASIIEVGRFGAAHVVWRRSAHRDQ